MRRVAHISDLHFGRTDPAVVEALVAELNRDPPDLIVASGDFTMRARRKEYVAARAFLDRLTAPWIAVPGNHDIAYFKLLTRFFHPFGRYRRFIAKDTEPTFLDDEIAVVCLNTVRTWAPETDWSQGKITWRRSPAPRSGWRRCRITSSGSWSATIRSCRRPGTRRLASWGAPTGRSTPSAVTMSG